MCSRRPSIYNGKGAIWCAFYDLASDKLAKLIIGRQFELVRLFSAGLRRQKRRYRFHIAARIRETHLRDRFGAMAREILKERIEEGLAELIARALWSSAIANNAWVETGPNDFAQAAAAGAPPPSTHSSCASCPQPSLRPAAGR